MNRYHQTPKYRVYIGKLRKYISGLVLYHSIKTSCAECGTPLWGINLHRIGELYYCSADAERLSTTEARLNRLKEIELTEHKKMFDGSGAGDLISNGTFDSDTIWTKGTGWTISGGTATSDGTQSAASALSQATPTKIEGVEYIYVFDVIGITAGNIRVQQSASHFGTSRSADGTYTETLFQFFPYSLNALSADSDFVGSVDNFSVRRAGK